MKFGLGQSVLRTEDERLITGKGRFTDDMTAPGAVHGVTVRSPYGHAKILSIDTSAALAVPGVLAVYTADDIAAYGDIACLVVFNKDAQTPHMALCKDVVRHVGDGVAFVVAESRDAARAGADAVMVDYEDLPAVGSIDEAIAPGASAVWEHSPNNIPWTWTLGQEAPTDSAIAAAHHVTSVRLVQQRVAPTSMEVRAALAEYTAEGGFTLTVGSQGVANMRMLLCGTLRISPDQLRVVTHDVGGGFGMKSFIYPEYILCLHAARALGRPVKWTGDRSDAFQSDMMGRDLISNAQIALDKDGLIQAIKVETWSNLGAYQGVFGPAIQTVAGGKMIGGVYRIPALFNKVHGVLTNTTGTDAYRGAGRPEACYITERLIEAAAAEMGIASDDIRRRNLLRADELPHNTMLGNTFDVGNFPAVLDKALDQADWSGFGARAAQSKAKGLLRGRGMCFYVEVAAGGGTEEFADARIGADGIIEVAVGTQANGQGHETAYAQVVAARLGVDFEKVRIVQGDTARLEKGHGTGGSRSLQFGGGACVVAADQMIDLGNALAKQELAADDVSYAQGIYTATGTNRTVSLFELAARHPQALDTRGHYKVPEQTPVFPNGCHVAEVEVDPDTGVTRVVKYTVVDDFGTLINPMLVQGQVHGGIAQGLGQVLIENMVYGEGAQLLTGSFMDYGVPRADDMPYVEFDTLPVPNPNNPLGVKGCGEAGTIGALASVMHALLDALKPYGISHLDMPATPQIVWRAIQAASSAKAA
jgi:aerobic carbon-monoxide dehydrogenase large subunit